MLGDGTEFTAMQPVMSYRHLVVNGVGEKGMLTEGIDHTYGDPVGPLLLQCGGCGHEWPTKRQIDWEAPSDY